MKRLVSAIIAVLVLLCASAGAVAATGASSTPMVAGHASTGSWVTVYTWPGGGQYGDTRDSAPFTLQGGHQKFHASITATRPEYTPFHYWIIKSEDGGSTYEWINVDPDVVTYDRDMYLKAGSCYFSANTLWCSWTVSISEWRGSSPSPTPTPTTSPTASPTPTPTPSPTLGWMLLSLKLNNAYSDVSVKLGKKVTATGTVYASGGGVTKLAGKSVKLTVQRRSAGKWSVVKSAKVTVSPMEDYVWKYKPLKKGSYCMQASIAAIPTHEGDDTDWIPFAVK